MKKVSKLFPLFFVISSLLMLSGCFYTTNPIYTDKDIIFDQGLVGEWERDNGNTVLAFTRDGNGDRYRLAYKSGAVTQEYVVHLVQLENQRFLDFYPASTGAPKRLSPVLPLHAIARVNQDGSTLRLSFIDSEWMSRGLVPLVDQDLVFTGTTEEAQQLLRKLSAFQSGAFIPVDYNRR